MKKRRSNETTHDSLSSCNTTNTGVHLTQLITKSVKASIHVLKLHHDRIEVTSSAKEEGANVDRAKEAGGVAVSFCGCVGQSWASLCLKVATFMAHMTKKWSDSR